MSRVGKKPIEVPQGVEVKIEGRNVEVKGPKGVLAHKLPAEVGLEKQDNQLLVIKKTSNSRAGAFHGLTRTLLANMVKGVTEGFEKRLTVNGIGYRVAMQGDSLMLSLGYSHPILYRPPEGVTLELVGRSEIVVRSIDKQKVGQAAAERRGYRKP